MMNQSEFIVGIDIGTTKIVAIAGRLNEFGKLEVISVGKSDSHGVKRGVVANIDKTVASIREAVEKATAAAGIEMNVAYVGIAGQHIDSLQDRAVIVRDNIDEEISFSDIDRLKSQMYKLVLPPGDRVIHVLPQEFIVDDEQGIKDPVGMAGIRLEGNFHIITGQIAAAKNIHKCVTRAGVEVSDLILEPIASAEAVLSEEEMEAGVALVDIGGGTTDIAIFQDGIIRHTAVIPFGGDIVTEDIKGGCKILKKQAEQLKVDFGSAIPIKSQASEIVAIPRLRNREPKEITIQSLSRIIKARMEEILTYVKYEIQSSGYENKLIGGIVLTGGGAQLKHIIQLTELVTGMDVRIGYPNEHLASSSTKDVHLPMYATAVGLLIKGAKAEQLYEPSLEEKFEQPVTTEYIQQENNETLDSTTKAEPKKEENKKEKKTNWFKSILNPDNIKKWFEDDFTEFDND